MIVLMPDSAAEHTPLHVDGVSSIHPSPRLQLTKRRIGECSAWEGKGMDENRLYEDDKEVDGFDDEDDELDDEDEEDDEFDDEEDDLFEDDDDEDEFDDDDDDEEEVLTEDDEIP